jgi:hypothetical protein
MPELKLKFENITGPGEATYFPVLDAESVGSVGPCVLILAEGEKTEDWAMEVAESFCSIVNASRKGEPYTPAATYRSHESIILEGKSDDFVRYYEGTVSRSDYSTKILATWRAMNLVEVKKGDLLFADLESFSRSAQVLDVIALVRAMDYKGAEAKINAFTHKISTSERKAAWIKAMGEVVG